MKTPLALGWLVFVGACARGLQSETDDSAPSETSETSDTMGDSPDISDSGDTDETDGNPDTADTSDTSDTQETSDTGDTQDTSDTDDTDVSDTDLGFFECDPVIPPDGVIAVDSDCQLPHVPLSNVWQAQAKWSWPGFGGAADRHSNVTPIVGQFVDHDNDGDLSEEPPDIAVVVYDNSGWFPTTASIALLHGPDGTVHWQHTGMYWLGTPVIADTSDDALDNPLLYGVDSSLHVVALRPDNTVAWTSAATLDVANVSPILLAGDVDNDGDGEILANDLVFDGTTGALVQDLPEPHHGSISTAPVWWAPVLSDLDGNGDMEAIIGSSVYHADTGALYWSENQIVGADGMVSGFPGRIEPFSAVVEIDGDPQAEVAMVGDQKLVVFQHDGSSPAVYAAGGLVPTPPCVGDIDGDGEPDIVWTTTNAAFTVANTHAYSLDGALLWNQPSGDLSGANSCSVFDFDGDGAQEVVTLSHADVRILDGETGVTLVSIPHDTYTALEYAPIVDLDLDGIAELLVVDDSRQIGTRTGLTAYEHPLDAWLGAESRWPSYDSSDPGTVHGRESLRWDVADLTSEIVDVCVNDCDFDSTVEMVVEIGNQGPLDATGVEVSVYSDGSGGLTWLDTQVIPSLPSGETTALVFDVPYADIDDGLWAIVDDDGLGNGSILECDEANNPYWWGAPTCP